MVNNFLKSNYIKASILFFVILCASCETDFLGLFSSEDLGKRLEAASSFPYFENRGHNWPELNIGNQDYSFLFITDTHITNDNTRNLEKLKNKFIASDKFVIFGGDITQSGARSELQTFVDITTAWRRVDASGTPTTEPMPCYPVIGNHDIFFDNWKIWKELIGSTRYRIDSDDTGGTSLIILDTANACFGNDQLDWLAGQLRSAKQNTFIFAHGTLFVDSNPATRTKSIPAHERARIISIISGSPATKAYLSGHIHLRTEQTVQGRKYFSLEDFKTQQAFMRITVSGGGVTYSFGSL
jgi:predicted phosphodiesterase